MREIEMEGKGDEGEGGEEGGGEREREKGWRRRWKRGKRRMMEKGMGRGGDEIASSHTDRACAARLGQDFKSQASCHDNPSSLLSSKLSPSPKGSRASP